MPLAAERRRQPQKDNNMRKHTVRLAVEALETRLALNGATPVPVLTTRAYHQATDRIEDAAEDFADDFADAVEDFAEGGFDEGENLEEVFEARLDLLKDLDKVSRKIPFGRRELLPEFRDTVDEVLAGLQDGTIPVTDDDFEDDLAALLEQELLVDLRDYVDANALTADNAAGTFVVLQSKQRYDTDQFLPVVGQVGSPPSTWLLGDNGFPAPARARRRA